MMEENEQLRKKLQTVSGKLERASADLKTSEEERKKLSERLQQMETHRDLLLDKVCSTTKILIDMQQKFYNGKISIGNSDKIFNE